MRTRLSLESLAVETFATEDGIDPSHAAAVAPSRYYSECYSCGIVCTAFLCL
jgi:hypothetical protein